MRRIGTRMGTAVEEAKQAVSSSRLRKGNLLRLLMVL